ncbi:MAG: peroxiredoxin family protein [Tepidisphaeraceae bacterium]
MPVTQRFVHTGLLLTLALFGLSVSVLSLGASRSVVTNDGLPGSMAANFHLRDSSGKVVSLRDHRSQVQVLIVSRVNSPLLAKSAASVEKLCETFGSDPSVRILGVEFDPSAGVLDAATMPDSPLDPHLADLRTLFDMDGSVARAYRVSDVPALFVIDDAGRIRTRSALDGSELSTATVESIASLRRPENLVIAQPTDRLTP